MESFDEIAEYIAEYDHTVKTPGGERLYVKEGDLVGCIAAEGGWWRPIYVRTDQALN